MWYLYSTGSALFIGFVQIQRATLEICESFNVRATIKYFGQNFGKIDVQTFVKLPKEE